jgi:hypothetical protein
MSLHHHLPPKPVNMSIVTLSIKDVPYPLVPNTAFHPINTEAALQRIRADFFNKVSDTVYQYEVTMDIILTTVLNSPKAKSVWAIAFEYHNHPFYIVRNLAHTNTTLPYRRVLVVKLDAFLMTYPTRIWDQVRSSLMRGEFYPLPSTTTWQ